MALIGLVTALNYVVIALIGALSATCFVLAACR